MLGIEDADHEETAPDAVAPVISKLSCSLVGKTETVRIAPGSIAFKAVGREDVAESFACSYGVNPRFRDRIENSPLSISGVDAEGGVRIVELPGHPFYVGTLFLPQVISGPGNPHPLIVAFLEAVLSFQGQK